MASLSVFRSSRNLVKPKEETPSWILNLSAIDKIPVLRCYARTLHVYKHGGNEAAAAIREALSKALVPYYPLAGRLKQLGHGGDVQLECSGEGVWFVEAKTDSSLADFNFFDNVVLIPYEELLPDQIPEGKEPLVQIQVTGFACGGFVIGLRFCHTVCDGLGSAQFVSAIGELARMEQLSVSPVWNRDFPFFTESDATAAEMPKLPPPIPDYRLEHANFDISMDEIDILKKEFLEKTGQHCSAFEIIAAGFWKLRTEAVNLDPETEVKLVFMANCRHLIDPPLPRGFYGNCFFPVTITASSKIIKNSSTFEVVKLIQEAKSKLPAEFAKYRNGDFSRSGEDPFAPPLIYSTLFLSEWGRLGFNQVDFGWGPPVHVVPIQGASFIPVGIVGSPPLPKKGIRLMTWSVEAAHREPLLDLMRKLI